MLVVPVFGIPMWRIKCTVHTNLEERSKFWFCETAELHGHHPIELSSMSAKFSGRETVDAISEDFGYLGFLVGFAFRYGPTLIVSALLSRIFLLAAMFLPVKILIVLESGRIPAYFPDQLTSLRFDYLVTLMAIGAVISYGLHYLLLLAESALLKNARMKLPSLKRRRGISVGKVPSTTVTGKQAKQVFRVATDAMFFLLGLISVGLLFPLVFLLQVATLLGITIFVAFSLMRGEDLPWKLARRGPILTLGFLVTVGAVIAMALFSGGPNLTIMMVSLLLMRQGTNALVDAAGTSSSLRQFGTATPDALDKE